MCNTTQCDAINGNAGTQIWKLRCSFPIYIIAMSATAGAMTSPPLSLDDSMSWLRIRGMMLRASYNFHPSS